MDRTKYGNYGDSYEVVIGDYAVYMNCMDNDTILTTGASYMAAAIMVSLVTLMTIAF